MRDGIDAAIARGKAYAPYADLIWCETSVPDLDEAEKFAAAIHEVCPDRKLAYNCSPSFNWKKHLSDAQIASFQKDLAKMGYGFQFITLAGFHSLNHGMFQLAKRLPRERDDRRTSSCRRPSSRPRRTATRRRATSARSAPATSTRCSRRSPAGSRLHARPQGLDRGVAVRGRRPLMTPSRRATSSPRTAIAFLTDLQRTFGPRREELLALRVERAARLAAGELPDFLPETASIREGDWKVAPYPAEIADRRVEITGPVDRKMVINALNSGAKVFMADFEDANSPTWENVISGQRNLTDALDRTIELITPDKEYRLGDRPGGAVRPPARLAHGRDALRGRRQADVGLALRLRPLLLPQPHAERPVLLPPEDGVAPRGATLERRLHVGGGAARRRARAGSRARC